jgi:uncharacterized protein (DUF2252 family)
VISRALRLGLVLVVAACGPSDKPLFSPPPPPPPPSPDTFTVDGARLRATDPSVAKRVAVSPFNYFRYQNRAFADRVCSRWASRISTMPLVHVHGDAHIEQYAVAEGGRGLSDFDAAGEGPPVIDFARFAASIALARPYDRGGTKAAIGAMFRGYLRALDDPKAFVTEPRAATRLRSRFAPTTEAWLDRVTALVVPTDPADHEKFAPAWKKFVGDMCTSERLNESFFNVKKGGKLELGIGSAHAEKYLARIEGPTSAADDDIMLEAKALQPGALASCMRGVDLDATRVIETQMTMSAAPQRFLGAMTISGKPFYTHAWQVQYIELGVGDIANGDELGEIAEDVGLQLGRGHAKAKDPKDVPALRRRLHDDASRLAPEVESAAFELALEVSHAWERFRASMEVGIVDAGAD